MTSGYSTKENWTGLISFTHRNVRRMIRVSAQTLLAPWVTAVLYIFVFGSVVGVRIGPVHGFSYVDFVLPGIVMMNVIMSAFADASSNLFMQRFTRSVEEVLVAPFSYFEMIIGFVVSGIFRGFIVGVGVYALALLFTSAGVLHFWLFALYIFAIATIFSFVGMAVGIMSSHFEHVSLLNTFVIMPLIFLGGVFNSVSMLPPALQTIVSVNPFFYFVDGIRFAMLGFHESNLAVGALIIVFLTLSSGFLVWYFFKTGYRIRE